MYSLGTCKCPTLLPACRHACSRACMAGQLHCPPATMRMMQLCAQCSVLPSRPVCAPLPASIGPRAAVPRPCADRPLRRWLLLQTTQTRATRPCRCAASYIATCTAHSSRPCLFRCCVKSFALPRAAGLPRRGALPEKRGVPRPQPRRGAVHLPRGCAGWAGAASGGAGGPPRFVRLPANSGDAASVVSAALLSQMPGCHTL